MSVIGHLIEWPDDPSHDWLCGFLAGIFDAEGSYSQGVWRVSNTDPEIIKWTCLGLDALNFDYVLEPLKRANGMVVVRLRGGLKEAMRFFHATAPAITRKRSIEGAAVKSGAKLRVTSIEPLGLEMPMYDITTGTGDFIANGVVSHNCFARNTHTYLDLDSGQDFNSKVIVKVNAPELLRAKLSSRGWAGAHIAMGTNVDCYQRAEGRYELMRGIIAALRDAHNPFSILTKGTLILRDLDLLLESAEVTDVGLNVSAGFVDRDLWRAIEPGTPAPQRRLDACAALNDAGLPLRRADGAGGAVPVRLPGPARGGRPAGRRGGRGARHPDRAAPAAGRPRVVPWLARRGAPGPGPPVRRAVRARRLRAQGLPGADRGRGPRARASGTASAAAAAFAASGWLRPGAAAAAGRTAWGPAPAVALPRGRAAGRTAASRPRASSCRCSDARLTF